MAQDDVIDKSNSEALKKVLEKEAEFDEEEAYYELCEIIALAQQTGNYTRFQNDLAQWKKHYPIELFSDKYKSKIKYMLSEEFLDSILKNYLAFEKYSKLDPNKQLDKFRKIFFRAEQHKDEKKLDSELSAFYKDYPLEYLKEKFPHIVAKLTSKSYRDKVLQKFDSKSAYEEFLIIINNPKDYNSLSDFEYALEPLKEKYPIKDFSEEYRSKLDSLISESSLKQIFENSNEDASLDISDLDDGTVIDLDESKSIATHSGIFNQKTAYFELIEIMKNPNNVNGIFDWTYKYMEYIGRFDDYHKGLVLSTLLPYYKIPKQHDYRIPAMNSQSHDYLSFNEYQSIDEIKYATILQYLAIISTTGSLSLDDIRRLQVIHDNSVKAKAVSTVANSLDLFIEKNDNTLQLTLSDPEYFGDKPASSSSVSGGVTISQFEEQKKHNNSGSTDSGGVTVSQAQVEESVTTTDFVISDDVKASDTHQDNQETLITIDYTNNLGNDEIEIKTQEISSSNSENTKEEISSNSDNSSNVDTSSTSDESTAYKVIPFDDNENSNDSERTKTHKSNYIPVINPELSLDEEENNSNTINSNPTLNQDIVRDFSTFMKCRIDDDDDREL